MATGIKSKKNWQRKHLNTNKINEKKNWCIDQDVPIHTHGLLNIVRAVIDEIAPRMGKELATEQARIIASYHLAVVSGRQVRFKIYSAQCNWRCDDDNFELFNDLGCSAKLNFLPIVDYINQIGRFEQKVKNSIKNIRYIPKIDEQPIGIEFLRQATDLSMQHAQGIPVIPKNGDVSAHFQLPNDIDRKHFDEFQKRMRNFRNPEPEVALPSFDLKKSGDYVNSQLLQHDTFSFRLRCFVEEINFESDGSPTQLVASNGNNGRAWSTSSLTTRELFLGYVYGFGERFFDVDSDIHEERIASVKCHFDTEDVTRVIVYNAMQKKNWIAEYIPRNAVNESPFQIRIVPINTHRLLDIIWNVILLIRPYLSKGLREEFYPDQACMDAFYHLAVYSGYQVRMKVLLAQEKFPMKIPLNFEQRKEIYSLGGGLRSYSHQFKNFQPIVDFIDHIGNFQHENVSYVPELNMPPDGVGFLRQATDLSMLDAQSFISENGRIPAHHQQQNYSNEFQQRISKFRLSENSHRALNIQESKRVVETLLLSVAYKLDSFTSYVNLGANGTKIQLVASKADGTCWSNIDLKSGELYLGAVYGFGECFFDENSYAHKSSIAVVNNWFDGKTDFAISDIVQNDFQQHMRKRGSDSSSSSE